MVLGRVFFVMCDGEKFCIVYIVVFEKFCKKIFIKSYKKMGFNNVWFYWMKVIDVLL